MTALVFVDTNVLVYARDPRDPLKGMERPPRRKWLSSTEVALCKFLRQRRRKVAAA